jgi:cysteinyl-tRNA synthetase
MALVLYDTMTRSKRPFEPRDPRRVTMYVCGPTVYDFAHIGNFRPVVVFDVLFRMLRATYGADSIVYAANVTDVDDKINGKAILEGVPTSVIANRYLEAYNADAAALNALPPTIQPRATEAIEVIVDLVRRLEAGGYAYESEGHVLFSVEAYPAYGGLSGRDLDDMIAGSRVEIATYKRNPADFVLWKPSKPGEPEWESPWGPGRPGWHIECSAMIEQSLGLPIDLHGGGNDLIFPHHENEIAQGAVCAGESGEYSRFWLHNGFLRFGDEKMSKSLGNVVRAHDLLSELPGEAIRWALLAAHYRAPLEWTGSLIEQSRKALDRLYGALDRRQDVVPSTTAPSARFTAALEDDINTPEAFAELFALASRLETGDPDEQASAKGELLASANLLGFLEAEPEAWFQSGVGAEHRARIEQLLRERAEARAAKDWPQADRIRDELAGLNVEVLDSRSGVTWRVKTS